MSKFTNSFMVAINKPLILFCMFITVLIISAFFYSIFESKNFWDSIWWPTVTAMTVGYGDTYPATTGGRVVATFLMIFTVMFSIPMIIAQLTNKLIADNDVFSRAEQEKLMGFTHLDTQ